MHSIWPVIRNWLDASRSLCLHDFRLDGGFTFETETWLFVTIEIGL